jgi:hypothetical protein
MPPFRRRKRDIRTYIRTYIHTNITRKALKFEAIMEKTPNSSAPTLKLVNGPAGRDYIARRKRTVLQRALKILRRFHFPYNYP